ncbi:MAG: RNA polymerase sigma factor [Gammaproteobacteria bacterium]|nr:RNA polymerase sigma factor [Gammaproteobacteria bacterium]
MSREDGDEALMLRYRNGDVRAFELLYERHKGPLFRYFLRQCPQRAVAEELFQEVWTSVVRSRERYRVRAKFTTLLYRMAHNRLIDYRRSAASNPGHDGAADVYEDRPDGSAAADERLDADRRAAALRRAIASLPPEQREAFLLREEGGLRLEQIAQVTGVGSETAKSRLRYAVMKLREALSKA